MSRDLRIRIRTVGAETARSALRGVVRETTQGNAARTRSSRQVTQAVVTGARAEERAVVQALQRETTAATRAATARQRAARQATDGTVREARREADGVIRERNRAERNRPRRGRGGGNGGNGGLGGVVGAGVQGAANEAAGVVDRYAGAGGARSREQLVQERADRRQRLIRLNRQMGGERGGWRAMDRQIQEVAGRTGIDQGDLTASLETAQARFTSAPEVLANLEQYARTAQATGASTEDVVSAMGNARNAYGLTPEQMPEALALMVDAGNRGSIDAGELASTFGPALGTIRRGTQMGGIEGLRQTLGIAEVMGAGGQSAAESTTMSSRFVEALNTRSTQRSLRRAGVNVLDRNGAMRPIEQIVEDMAGSSLATSPRLMQDAFANVNARDAAGVLISQFNQNPDAVRGLFAADAQAGQDYVNQTVDELNADPSANFLRQGIKQEQAMVAGGQEAQVMTTMAQLGTEMTTLTSQYPLASEALGVFTAGLQQAGGLLALVTALGGGGGAGGGLLGGAVAGGGAAAGGAGLAGLLPFLLGGGAIAATVGAGVMTYQKNAAEVARRSAGEAYLRDNPGAITPDLVANVTGDASVIGPDAQRRRSSSSLGRSRDATMNEIMGGDAASPAAITVLPSSDFTRAVTEAVRVGAQAGIDGRDGEGARGQRRDRQRHPGGSTR